MTIKLIVIYNIAVHWHTKWTPAITNTHFVLTECTFEDIINDTREQEATIISYKFKVPYAMMKYYEIKISCPSLPI